MDYCTYCLRPLEDGVCPGHCQPPESAPHILPPGTLLNGRYLVGAALGQGGFGITYIGRDQVLDIRVAIKEYYPNGFVTRNVGASPEVVITGRDKQSFVDRESEKFLAEARVLAKFIGEKGIVDVRDYFRANSTAYIVMEYLDGETLRDYLQHHGVQTPDQTFALLAPVMRSLDKVHQAGLIHRDISPDNIMLTRDGSVKLLDFGTARAASPAGEQSLSVMLKPGYAPEEQYRTKGSQGPWTDIYALCATMYKCITGITPIDSLERLFEDTVVPPSQLGIPIDPAQEAALMMGMACRREDRFQSVGALAAALGLAAGPVMPTDQGGTAVVPETVRTGDGTLFPPPGDDGRTILTPQDDGRTVLTGEHGYRLMEDIVSDGGAAPPEDPGKTVLPDGLTGGGQKGGQSAGQNGGSLQKNTGSQRKAGPPEKKQKSGGGSAKAVLRQTPPPKKRSGKPVLIGVGVVLALVVGLSVLWRMTHTVNVGGQTYTSENSLVSFSKVTVTAEDIEKLRNVPTIKTIYFSYCELAPGALEAIGGLEQIETVEFHGDVTNFTTLDPLAAAPNLEDITIFGQGPVQITASFPQVKRLNISAPEDVTDLGFLSCFPDLTSFSFWMCGGAETEDFSPIGGLAKLERLNLMDSGVSDVSFLANLPELRELDLSYSGDDARRPNHVSDISALSACSKLEEVDLTGNELTDLTGLESSAASLRSLTISKNQVVSLVPLAGCAELRDLYADRNALTSLAGLEEAAKLQTLQVNNNVISDLTPLTNLHLWNLLAEHNHISDLTPLAGHEDMRRLRLGYNDLTSLAGCEALLRLEELTANDNAITDINGITNCTVLKSVQLSYNDISDISLLGKNGEDLEKLEVSDNALTGLNGLESCVKLQALNIGRNQVKSLAPLASMPELTVLMAAENDISDLTPLQGMSRLAYLDLGNNQISDITPLGTTTGLAYLDLSRNQIRDIAPLANLNDEYAITKTVVNVSAAILYLEHNQITDISQLPQALTYWKISLYGNPIQDLSRLAELKYETSTMAGVISNHVGVYLPYRDGLDYTPMSAAGVQHIYVTGAPLDRRIPVEQAAKPSVWGGGVEFYDEADFDALLAADKFTGIESAGPENAGDSAPGDPAGDGTGDRPAGGETEGGDSVG